MSRRIGQKFQEDVETSCKEQAIFFHNIKDVFLPPDVRRRVRLPKNKYDTLMFFDGYLFPTELKTTNKRSLSFSESIIKQHQIDNLEEATKYNGVIPGFIINFREQPENKAYFIHINDFIKFKHIAENQLEHNYRSYKNKKLNRASIPIAICEEIGVEINSIKKRVRYRYDLTSLFNQLIARNHIYSKKD